MQAKPGDQIRVKGHNIGQHARCGRLVEVRGSGGAPPFVVRWDDTEHEVLFFPGTDAVIEHLDPAAPHR